METSIPQNLLQKLQSQIAPAHDRFHKNYPGVGSRRQPLHTIYGGAHLFKAQTVPKLGALALRALDLYAPDSRSFHQALQQPPGGKQEALAATIYQRVRRKLATEPVEDFRIDFEDGFGPRSDAEEDQTAVRAAEELATAYREQTAAPYMGIRIKPFSRVLAARGLRTLDIFVTTLAKALAGGIPETFLVTLPKVEYPEQITLLCEALGHIEAQLGLAPIAVEIMIETTQSIFDPEGRIALKAYTDACNGRCFAAHFGTYDYTASCDVISAEQRMDSPVCDFARHHMKVALAGTGVFLSDGATNIMPVGPHTGDNLTPSQVANNCAQVHAAWRLSLRHIQNSLVHGIYQGWDLHPAQIPIRYAAVYYYFLNHHEDAAQRLGHFLEEAAKATLSGNVFDDAATGQGLLNYFIRAWECGAIDETDLAATGLTLADLKTRSFPQILAKRR